MTSVGIADKQEKDKVIRILLKARVRARRLHERPTQDTRRGSHLPPLLRRLHAALRFRQVAFSPGWSFTDESLKVLASHPYKFCQ